jgi:hypothetical protein
MIRKGGIATMRTYAFVLVMALFLGLMVGVHMTADMVSADPIPGQRIQVPVIWTTEGWETEIKVQNVGTATARAIFFLWGPYSEQCEPNNPGPIIAQCSIKISLLATPMEPGDRPSP